MDRAAPAVAHDAEAVGLVDEQQRRRDAWAARCRSASAATSPSTLKTRVGDDEGVRLRPCARGLPPTAATSRCGTTTTWDRDSRQASMSDAWLRASDTTSTCRPAERGDGPEVGEVAAGEDERGGEPRRAAARAASSSSCRAVVPVTSRDPVAAAAPAAGGRRRRLRPPVGRAPGRGSRWRRGRAGRCAASAGRGCTCASQPGLPRSAARPRAAPAGRVTPRPRRCTRGGASQAARGRRRRSPGVA